MMMPQGYLFSLSLEISQWRLLLNLPKVSELRGVGRAGGQKFTSNPVGLPLTTPLHSFNQGPYYRLPGWSQPPPYHWSPSLLSGPLQSAFSTIRTLKPMSLQQHLPSDLTTRYNSWHLENHIKVVLYQPLSEKNKSMVSFQSKCWNLDLTDPSFLWGTQQASFLLKLFRASKAKSC